MRSITTLDLRRHVGRLLDEAAAGERIVIERSGRPLCALVPLADLELADPDRRLVRELEAIDDLQRIARRYPPPAAFDAAAFVRTARDERDAQVLRDPGGPRTARTRR